MVKNKTKGSDYTDDELFEQDFDPNRPGKKEPYSPGFDERNIERIKRIKRGEPDLKASSPVGYRPDQKRDKGRFADEGKGDKEKGDYSDITDPSNTINPVKVDPATESQIREVISRAFPNINAAEVEVVGEADRKFNCIATAFDDNQNWWWPGYGSKDHWPKEYFHHGDEMASFNDLLIRGAKGVVTTDEKYEKGFTKLALFADETLLTEGKTVTVIDAKPTHIAKLLPNGKWMSKLGEHPIIMHDVHEMGGGVYGKLHKIYKLTDENWKQVKNLPMRKR